MERPSHTLNPMSSPWNIWCHPKRTAAELADMQARLDEFARYHEEMDAYADHLKARLDACQAAVADSREVKDHADSRAAEAEMQAERLKEEIAALKERLTDEEEFRRVMEDFETRLAESQKRHKYLEDKIETLQIQLEDARDRLRRATSETIADPRSIDMRPKPKPKDPSRWLKSLPPDLV